VIAITLPGGFSALSLKLDATRHSFHHNTQHPHSRATAATLHYSQTINPESDMWRFLGSMPAIQRYKIHPQRDIIHEVTGLNGVGCWRSQNSIADSSTTTAPILNLIAGECWARRQLRSGIKDVSVASKLRKSLTFVRVVFIDTLAITELDGRFLHNHCSDPGSDCGRLLGSTPAFQRYKVHLCRIRTQEFAVFCGEDLYSSRGDILLDGRLLHNRWTDFDALCGRSLGSTPAFQRYKVRLCRIRTQEFAVFCGKDLYSSPGDILLDGRLLHDRWTDLAALCGTSLASTPAFQRYKVRLCRIGTQEFAVFCGEDLYSSPGDTLLDGRLLHDRWTDFDSVCGRSLGMAPAFQRYKVRLCRIETHEFAVFCGGWIRYQAGDILLDGSLLHDRLTDSDALCGRLLAMAQALQ